MPAIPSEITLVVGILVSAISKLAPVNRRHSDLGPTGGGYHQLLEELKRLERNVKEGD